MRTLTYEVTGDNADPQAFMAYLHQQLKDHQALHITARQVDLDELAARRGADPATLEFDFIVNTVTYEAPAFVIGYQAEAGSRWLHIDIGDENVRFDVMS